MFNDIIAAIGSIYNESWEIRCIIWSLLSILTIHVWSYRIIGFFCTRKFKPAKHYHKYAILIAARNEETVIGNLLDSIKKQDYPQEYLTVFVVADNCDDKTAEIARSKGAICYERSNKNERTKGFALRFLFENIKKDYGIESFEGYFIFDADNLLNVDYISRMNDSFDAGEKIITSYRNTKNFDENWIASTYAIHWLRSIRFRHRARSVMRLATNIQGTGFLFANELVRDGWRYTSLTEDRAFTADAVAHGYPISYNDAAEFFDEQPTSIRVALRQRIRWSKGHLLAFQETGWLLFKNIFLGNSFRQKKAQKEKFTWAKLAEEIRLRWASFDTLAQLVPTAIIKVAVWLIVSVFIHACLRYTEGLDSAYILRGNNGLSKILHFIFFDGFKEYYNECKEMKELVSTVPSLSHPQTLRQFLISFKIIYIDTFNSMSCTALPVSAEPGITAALLSVGLAFIWNSIGRINYHFKTMTAAAYVFFTERKRIIKIKWYKKLLYCLTWPVFDAIGRWTMYFALFMKVEWKPIPHISSVTIDDIAKSKEEIANGKQ